jgi:hypothetical protein
VIGKIRYYPLPITYSLAIMLYLAQIHKNDFLDQYQLRLSRLALKIVVMARQEARGKSEEGLGDFTFRYIFRFFSVHLLNPC